MLLGNWLVDQGIGSQLQSGCYKGSSLASLLPIIIDVDAVASARRELATIEWKGNCTHEHDACRLRHGHVVT